MKKVTDLQLHADFTGELIRSGLATAANDELKWPSSGWHRCGRQREDGLLMRWLAYMQHSSLYSERQCAEIYNKLILKTAVYP